MVFLKKDHHPVGEFDALGLDRLERRQRRNRDLPPIRGLAESKAAGKYEHKNGGQRVASDEGVFHCAPPGDAAGLLVSIIPTVRLIGDRKSTRLNSSHRCSSYAV